MQWTPKISAPNTPIVRIKPDVLRTKRRGAPPAGGVAAVAVMDVVSSLRGCVTRAVRGCVLRSAALPLPDYRPYRRHLGSAAGRVSLQVARSLDEPSPGGAFGGPGGGLQAGLEAPTDRVGPS